MTKRIEHSDLFLSEVKRLFHLGCGERRIAKILFSTRSIIKRILKEFNLCHDLTVSLKFIQIDKKCIKCNIIKTISSFYSSLNKNGKQYVHSSCIDCELNQSKIYRNNNLEKISTKEKEYRFKNKLKINTNYNLYIKHRKENDFGFKLRKNFSSIISVMLSKNGKSKINTTCYKYFNFSDIELKQYIESLFEPWMNWNNYGKYNSKSWDDDNVLTWTWNIDHIIPQSDLPYTSMIDENFRKCWSLENLRPYSSKQNILDGVNRTRHEK